MNKPDLEESGWIELKKLKPHPDNAKDHSEEQIQRIARSIDKLGWGKSITISKDLYILAGHGAAKASEGTHYLDDLTGEQCFFKSDKIPYKFLDYPNTPSHSDPRAIAYMHADNKIAEESDWIYGKLDASIANLELQGFDTTLTAFKDSDLEGIKSNLSEINESPIPGEEPEFDENVADDVEMVKCPECGHEFPK